MVLRHPAKSGRVVVTMHKRTALRPGTVAQILKDARDISRGTEGAAVRSYTVILIPDPDEGGYTVTVPVLPG